MGTADPFGRAIRDYYHDRQEDPLLQRDGSAVEEHPIEQYYFWEFRGECAIEVWVDEQLDGPLLDLGAGVGVHTRYFQQQFETIAIEVSEHLVATMRQRGVLEPRHADMFSLRDTFERDRFRSVLSHGTQLGLAGSIQGLRQFLCDIAFVTGSDGTAVVDCYDPGGTASALLGYRPDPTPGLAHRVFHFEYESEVGRTLLFRLFSPDRVKEATVGTSWEVGEIRRDTGAHPDHYYLLLEKSQ